MKVLHINSYEKAGGAEQVATDLLNNPFASSVLIVKGKSSGDPRIIALPHNTLDRLFTLLNQITFKSRRKNTFKALFSITENFNATYSKLKKIKAYQEADIIHLHNIHGNYFDLQALRLIAREKKVVWTLHDMWAVTGGEFYTYGNQNYRKGIGKTSIKYLFPLSQPLIDRRQHILEIKKKIYAEVKENLTFVPVSEWLNAAIKNSYVLPKGYLCTRIYNGYDHSIFHNRNQRRWDTPRILFYNQSGESKGSKLFHDVLPRLQSRKVFDLFVIGEEIEGVNNQVILPFIKDRDNLSRLYNDIDILVFPSITESFGLMPLEAMACGVCVVISDATALPELLTKDHGFIFKSENSRDLYRKSCHALKDLSRTRLFGDRASSHVSKHFNIAKCHEAYFSLYKQVLTNKYT